MRKPIISFSAIALVVTAQSISIAASDTEWDRTVLPRPPQPFEGVAKRTLEGSVASFAQPVKAPAGAPNILLVLIDDAGFGNPATFGGPVATPTFDKVAAQGLRYNRFHVTALCSPTRAAFEQYLTSTGRTWQDFAKLYPKLAAALSARKAHR